MPSSVSALFTSESARSAREHKAWGAASEASKPQDRNSKGVSARGAGDRLGVRWQAQRDTALDRPNDPRAVTRFAGSFVLWVAILGLTPQALCCRALRALYC